MDAGAIFVDVVKTFGKQLKVGGNARPFYPREDVLDAAGKPVLDGSGRVKTREDKSKPIEGYKLKLQSREWGVDSFNVKLPADFDPKSVAKGDLVELVEPMGRPYGSADGDFVTIDISVSAKALRKVQG